MTKIIDEALLSVMAELPRGWTILRFERANMGWVADIGKGETRLFSLVSDRGYIEVSMVDGNSIKGIRPPEDQVLEVSPQQVAELVLKHHACRTRSSEHDRAPDSGTRP